MTPEPEVSFTSLCITCKKFTGSAVIYKHFSDDVSFLAMRQRPELIMQSTDMMSGILKSHFSGISFYYSYEKFPQLHGLNNTHPLFYSSGGRNCETGLTEPKARCQQACTPGDFKGESLLCLVHF